jgi:Tfp pilus assembly protein PilO
VDKTRLWIIGSVLAMAIVVVLGWVVGVQPQLDQASAADQQTAQVDTTNTANAAVLARLKKDSESLPELKKQLKTLSASVPSGLQGDEFTAAVDALAASSGVRILGTEISDGQAYAAPADPAAAKPAEGGSSSSTATPSPSATPTPQAAATPSPGMPPVSSPLVDGTNFTVVSVTTTVSGEYANILAFVKALQTGPRLVLVDGIDIGPAASGSGYDAKVSGFLYVLSDGSRKAPTE